MFYTEIERIFKKSSEIILEKASHLIGNQNLTKQQMVMKGLMSKYIEVNNK